MTTTEGKKTPCNPPALQRGADDYHLSQAIRVGNMVWTSGQVGAEVAADGSLHIPQGLPAQTRLAFQNVKAALESAGATMADIVEMTIYVTDMSKDMEHFGPIKDEFVPAPYPAVTGVQISGLTLPGLLIEIKVVAVVGSGSD